MITLQFIPKKKYKKINNNNNRIKLKHNTYYIYLTKK